MRAAIRNWHFKSKAEVANRDCGDVGDRKAVARNEFVLGQLLVEFLMKSGNAKFATLNQRRDLRNCADMTRQTTVDEPGVRVAKDLRVPNASWS